MPSTTQTRRQGSPLWLKLVIGIVGAVMFGGILFVTTQIFGHVRGEEFSPQTFTRRKFSYYQIPLLQLKITPIARDVITGNVEDHLKAQKFITPTTTNVTWDLVFNQTGAAPRSSGEAELLANLLNTNDAGSQFIWEKWSEDHPQLAAVFWPYVMKFAQDGMYLHIPPLFRCAREASSADDLKAALQAQLTTTYERLAQRMDERGNPKRAAEIRQLAAEVVTAANSNKLIEQPVGNKAENEADSNDRQ